MSLIDGKSWWEENQATARLTAIYSLVAFVFILIFFHSEIKDFLFSHPWWQSALSQSNGVTTIEQKYEPEEAATALYSANFALALLVPLFDALLDGKRSNEVSIRMSKFTGHA